MAKVLKSSLSIALSASEQAAVQADVRAVIADVEARGTEAVREFSSRYDRWSPDAFEVTKDEIADCLRRLPSQAIDDLKFARAQIRRFAEIQKGTLADVERETLPGVILGHRHIPVGRVGCYVPGGTHPLVVSALMTIATAKVAGVGRVLACTPPFEGRLNAASIAAMSLAGADRIFCIGGAQAIAAMAFGAAGLEPVDMVVGPGNAHVTEAKRQLYGRVGVDLLAGLTEVLIIADHTADVDLCVADLLGQGEHGPSSRLALLTDDCDLAAAVLQQIEARLAYGLDMRAAAAAWRDYGQVIVCDDTEELIEQANELAFEHVQIMTARPASILDRLVNYGSAFLGEHANVAYGDKVIGTNHTLPTRAGARFTGGLWVGTFVKTCTYQNVLTIEASSHLAQVCSRLCALEALPAHKEQADLRLRRHFADFDIADGAGA